MVTPGPLGPAMIHRRLRRLMVTAVLLALPLVLAPVTGAAADDSAVTVPGPAVNPGSTVTVEKTSNLVNEVVQVRWTGFTPSDYAASQAGRFDTANTRYPVRVYQCRGTDPGAPGECYGSEIYEYPGRPEPIIPNYLESVPDGPPNYVQTATGPDGAGGVDIEVRTILESSTLGCDFAAPCSIVVVPNYGDPDRRDDTFPQFPACAVIRSALAQCQGDVINDPKAPRGNVIDASWAWTNRVVIPIDFADTGEACPLGDAQLTTLGSPKAQRALSSWQPSACTQADALIFDYTAQSEVLARNNFLNGLTDVGLTNRPADPVIPTDRTFTYAPVSASAVTVAFRVDDATTFQPITQMRLTPRLIAKMITQSYAWAYSGFDNPAIEGNPTSLFEDPEFLELNPGPSWPAGQESVRNATPHLLGELSDLTWELSRYLQADPEARAFLDGEPDEWGMRVSSHFTGVSYPVETFESRDPNPYMVNAFQPIQGLPNVAAKLVRNEYSGVSTSVDDRGNFYKFGPENRGVEPPGTRAFVAIIDSANAAAFRFPTAQLRNAAGEFVAPTTESMAAGVDAMTVNGDGITRSADVGSTDPAAYPLTMIDYAMVPTLGLDAETAEAAGAFLDYAAGPGQVTGLTFGGLPPGFLPLGDDLVAQTTAAAAAVRAQDGSPPSATPTPTPTTPPGGTPGGPIGPGSGQAGFPGGTGPGGGPGQVAIPGASGAAPSAGATPGAAPVGPGVPGVTTPVVDAAGPSLPAGSSTPVWLRYALPVVLVVGVGAAMFGTLGSWVVGRGGVSLPAPLRRGLAVFGRRGGNGA